MSCVVSFPDLRRGARDSGPKLWPSSRENRGKEERREERGERRGKEKREERKQKGKGANGRGDPLGLWREREEDKLTT
jgi:hypothetical protein